MTLFKSRVIIASGHNLTHHRCTCDIGLVILNRVFSLQRARDAFKLVNVGRTFEVTSTRIEPRDEGFNEYRLKRVKKIVEPSFHSFTNSRIKHPINITPLLDGSGFYFSFKFFFLNAI